MRSVPTATLLLLVLAAAAPAQDAVLAVTVLDAVSGAPVPGARVEVAGQAAETGRDGAVRLSDLPAGAAPVSISRIGYHPGRLTVEFEPGAVIEQTVRLRPDPIALRALEVEGERNDVSLERSGFLQRQRSGFGRFMTSERIEALRPTHTLDLFRHIPGFAIQQTPDGPVLITTRGAGNLALGCPVGVVYLDGLMVTGRVAAASVLRDVAPETIAGIEAYAGPATIPPQYNMTGAACGVVLIWTRSGVRGPPESPSPTDP